MLNSRNKIHHFGIIQNIPSLYAIFIIIILKNHSSLNVSLLFKIGAEEQGRKTLSVLISQVALLSLKSYFKKKTKSNQKGLFPCRFLTYCLIL